MGKAALCAAVRIARAIALVSRTSERGARAKIRDPGPSGKIDGQLKRAVVSPWVPGLASLARDTGASA